MPDDKAPLNFKFLQEGFLLAQRLGKTDEADKFRRLLDQAREENPGAIRPRDEVQIELSEVNRLLYQSMPVGFRAARDRLSEIAERSPWVAKDPSYAVFSACVLGQEYEFAKQEGAAPETLERIAAEALGRIRIAVDLGQTSWLRRLAQPTGAEGPTRDDDLAVLAADRREVRDALGIT